jgi:uncharacterized membrane protein
MPTHDLARSELDDIARLAPLDATGCERLLALAKARPTVEEWRGALIDFARVGGTLAIGAGAIFFIAANWSALAPGGRIALFQVLFVVCIGLALWRPAPDFVGRATLLLALLGVGGLFALFGQTFQTGADLYELFLLWAVLGLPFAIAARWWAVSALWLLVLNITLALLCGVVPSQHPLWSMFSMDESSLSLRLSVAMWPNLLLWGLTEWQARRVAADDAWLPRWLRQMLLLVGLGYGTLAVTWAIFEWGSVSAWVLLLFAAAAALVSTDTLARKREALPLVALAACLIVVGLAGLGKWIGNSGWDEAMLWLLPLWIVAASSVSAWVLVPLARRWEAAVE